MGEADLLYPILPLQDLGDGSILLCIGHLIDAADPEMDVAAHLFVIVRFDAEIEAVTALAPDRRGVRIGAERVLHITAFHMDEMIGRIIQRIEGQQDGPGFADPVAQSHRQKQLVAAHSGRVDIEGGGIKLTQEDGFRFKGVFPAVQDILRQGTGLQRQLLGCDLRGGDDEALPLPDLLCGPGLLRRVRQKEDGQCDAGDDGGQQDPEAGLFVAEHGPDAAPDAHLAEGQRTHGDHPVADGATDQGFGIGPDGPPVQLPDHPLVAGQLDIPAKEDVGQPHDGVEPVDGQQGKAQGLPQVVQPFQMGPFMGQDMVFRVRIQTGGQVDPGPQDAQDEGGA